MQNIENNKSFNILSKFCLNLKCCKKMKHTICLLNFCKKVSPGGFWGYYGKFMVLQTIEQTKV